MGHKNKNYQKTLHQQVYDKLTSMQAFGESKTTAKNDGTTSNKIFSFSTYASYYRCCQDFIKYIKITHPDVTTLTKAQKYVNEYLQKKVDANLSAWTVSLYTSALCKLYQISATDKNRFHPPTRHRSDIQRSRGHTRSDRHFSEKNHSELVDFCRGTGCRRNVLEKLESKNLWTQDDLIHKKLCLEKSLNFHPQINVHFLLSQMLYIRFQIINFFFTTKKTRVVNTVFRLSLVNIQRQLSDVYVTHCQARKYSYMSPKQLIYTPIELIMLQHCIENYMPKVAQ